MTSPGHGTDDKAGVTVRCQHNSSVGVAFCDRFSFDADSVHYAFDEAARWGEHFPRTELEALRRLWRSHQHPHNT